MNLQLLNDCNQDKCSTENIVFGIKNLDTDFKECKNMNKSFFFKLWKLTLQNKDFILNFYIMKSKQKFRILTFEDSIICHQ